MDIQNSISISPIGSQTVGNNGKGEHGPAQPDKGTGTHDTATNIDRKKLDKMVDGLNSMAKVSETHLQFKVHEELHEYYVQLVNDRGDVIREIPPKKLLDIAAAMHDFLGLVINKKV